MELDDADEGQMEDIEVEMDDLQLERIKSTDRKVVTVKRRVP